MRSSITGMVVFSEVILYRNKKQSILPADIFMPDTSKSR